MLISKIIRTQQFKYFYSKTKVNLVQKADQSGCINKANWKQVGAMGVLWHTLLLMGNGLRSTDKKKVYCFVLNFINVKYSFTSFY